MLFYSQLSYKSANLIIWQASISLTRLIKINYLDKGLMPAHYELGSNPK